MKLLKNHRNTFYFVVELHVQMLVIELIQEHVIDP